jgi:hypothetical protein
MPRQRRALAWIFFLEAKAFLKLLRMTLVVHFVATNLFMLSQLSISTTDDL